MSWKREGYCCQCGECCRGRDPFDGELGPPPVAGFCALYRIVDGKGSCSDRTHRYYLNGCNVWPSIPEHVSNYPRCTYTFTEVNDGG